MRRIAGLGIALGMAGCAVILGLPDPALDESTTPFPGEDGAVLAETSSEPPVDDVAPAPRCRIEDPFANPVELPNVNIGTSVAHPRLTADELEIYFEQSTPVVGIFVAKRTSRLLPFDPPQRVDAATPEAGVASRDPTVSGDGLVLFVTLDARIARLTRANRTSAFANLTMIGILDDPNAAEQDPHLLGDGGALYFGRADFANAQSLWRAANATAGFGQPVRVIVPGNPQHASPTDDELTMYYANVDDRRMYRVSRATTGVAFGTPVEVVELNIDVADGGYDRPGWLSPDFCRMYFTPGSNVAARIYMASRQPR